MVYCGKPSKGCQPCRVKKTRCDRQTPSCGQCIRANRTCPGYRSEIDLMFRNESEAVVGKAKAREKSKSKSKALPPEFPPMPIEHMQENFDTITLENEVAKFSPFYIDTRQLSFVQATLPDYTMFPTIQERSLAYFHTLSPTWLRDANLLDGLSSQNNADEHLLASMSAVGLASFSNSVHAPEIMVRARKSYVNALQLTNAALRSPIEAKKDSTLFAVMILGIFETITGSNERSLAAWTEHTNGAAALVKLRGSHQFDTPAGKSLFMQVTSSLMLSCVQRSIPMPQHIVNLHKEAAKFMDTTNPAWRLSEVIIYFTIFRPAVQDCKIVCSKAVIKAALEIDRKFVEVFEDIPEDWRYETVYTDQTPHLIWNDSYHVYKEVWMAHIYNGMRTCRILLHEIIRDQLLAASTALAPIFSAAEMVVQGESSVSIMLEMQTQILASVPLRTTTSLSEPAVLREGSRGYFMLWPLYLVGAMDLSTETIREWAIVRLRNIGETMGIRQAFVVANLLRSREWHSIWDAKPDQLQREIWNTKPDPILPKETLLENWREKGWNGKFQEVAEGDTLTPT